MIIYLVCYSSCIYESAAAPEAAFSDLAKARAYALARVAQLQASNDQTYQRRLRQRPESVEWETKPKWNEVKENEWESEFEYLLIRTFEVDSDEPFVRLEMMIEQDRERAERDAQDGDE